MALMVFDNKITNLKRIESSGENFYGQKTNQTFMTENTTITVQVQVTLGAAAEIESVSIPKGTITVNTQGQTKKLAVVGDAGC